MQALLNHYIEFPHNLIDILSSMAILSKRWMEKCSSIKGGYLMFTVTEKALEVIKDFIKEKKSDSAVRITLSIG
jgi:hypothetical protein